MNKYLHMSRTLLVQRSIIDSYRDDISKYAGQEKARAKLFFDAIPSELSKKKKRFIIADIEQRATAQKYENAAQWLMDAGIAYFSYNTHNLLLPFEQDAVLENPNPTLGELMVISKFPMQKIGDIQYIPLYALGWI